MGIVSPTKSVRQNIANATSIPGLPRSPCLHVLSDVHGRQSRLHDAQRGHIRGATSRPVQ